MFIWTEEMVRFLRDASEYGDYYAKLADWMAPCLSRTDHVCDAGCGLGYLSLELLRYVNQVTAIDRSAIPQKVLQEIAKHKENIHIICEDIHAVKWEKKFDKMMFSFFGKMEEIAPIAKTMCRDTVFVFKKNYVNHRFSVGEHPTGDDSFQNGSLWLRQHQVPYSAQTLSLEMGQPLRGWQEAQRFFALYNRGDEITDSELKRRLVETGRSDFPLYLPQRREIGCLQFRAVDLPEDV